MHDSANSNHRCIYILPSRNVDVLWSIVSQEGMVGQRAFRLGPAICKTMELQQCVNHLGIYVSLFTNCHLIYHKRCNNIINSTGMLCFRCTCISICECNVRKQLTEQRRTYIYKYT